MDNDFITCPSCNSTLKKALNSKIYLCYCPNCGNGIRILEGNKCTKITSEDLETEQNILNMRDELQRFIQLGQWKDASRVSYQLHDVTKDVREWLLTAECLYQSYLEQAMVYHAYLALYGIMFYESTYLKEKNYYENELDILKMILGITSFSETTIYDFICKHKPQCTELEVYGSKFVKAAIISAKYGRNHPEFTATNPKVIPILKSFAKKYNFKIPFRRIYTPIKLKSIKEEKQNKKGRE